MVFKSSLLVFQQDVSENSGFPPKSSILIGFSIIFTIIFGIPRFLETPNKVFWGDKKNHRNPGDTFQLSRVGPVLVDFFFCFFRREFFWVGIVVFLPPFLVEIYEEKSHWEIWSFFEFRENDGMCVCDFCYKLSSSPTEQFCRTKLAILGGIYCSILFVLKGMLLVFGLIPTEKDGAVIIPSRRWISWKFVYEKPAKLFM